MWSITSIPNNSSQSITLLVKVISASLGSVFPEGGLRKRINPVPLLKLLFILDNYLGVFKLPDVEDKRRVHLLSQSFGVPLDYEQTNLYYNNNLEPYSVNKYDKINT